MATVTVETPMTRDDARPVVAKHHGLVRLTHWLNIPLLLGLTLSGLSIYWAAPVFHYQPATPDGTTDYFATFGVWVTQHLPFLAHGYGTDDHPAEAWFYDHFSLGPGMLASALNLHWLFAYAFMLNGLLYLVGLGLGGGYKALLPRRTDLRDAWRMQVYYLGLPFAKLTRRPWPHPHITTKYNALQRGAYFAMPVMGALAVLTGWAIKKPASIGWLAALFGGYDWARVWHFWLMWVFVAFVIPHVILVLADGWDTLRSMVVGWSTRVPTPDPAAPND